MNRVPTDKQFANLAVLGATAIVLAPGRREWTPLLRRGWVEPISEDDKDKRFLPPLRITSAGLRAMADAMERDPELAPDIRGPERPKQLDEDPRVAHLKGQLAEAREQGESARREAHQVKVRLGRAQRALAGDLW